MKIEAIPCSEALHHALGLLLRLLLRGDSHRPQC